MSHARSTAAAAGGSAEPRMPMGSETAASSMASSPSAGAAAVRVAATKDTSGGDVFGADERSAPATSRVGLPRTHAAFRVDAASPERGEPGGERAARTSPTSPTPRPRTMALLLAAAWRSLRANRRHDDRRDSTAADAAAVLHDVRRLSTCHWLTRACARCLASSMRTLPPSLAAGLALCGRGGPS